MLFATVHYFGPRYNGIRLYVAQHCISVRYIFINAYYENNGAQNGKYGGTYCNKYFVLSVISKISNIWHYTAFIIIYKKE